MLVETFYLPVVLSIFGDYRTAPMIDERGLYRVITELQNDTAMRCSKNSLSALPLTIRLISFIHGDSDNHLLCSVLDSVRWSFDSSHPVGAMNAAWQARVLAILEGG